MPEKTAVSLRVLVIASALEGRWIAVCIDRYMVGHGNSPQEAADALKVIFRMEVERGVERGFRQDPLEHLSQAPPAYHDAYAAADAPPPPRAHTKRKNVHATLEQRMALSA